MTDESEFLKASTVHQHPFVQKDDTTDDKATDKAEKDKRIPPPTDGKFFYVNYGPFNDDKFATEINMGEKGLQS